ncbi:MAG: MATE family efflux transporter [Pontiellaceae bacterium]|jgi:MATE family multidrug resistance protein|nr:MATE family efflux transporter [Pontiellaceae bacterium]
MNAARTAASSSYRALLSVAVPLVITSVSFTVQNFCDRMFLAWYSPVTLQAAVPAGILFFTMVCGFMAAAGFASSLVAQYYGSGDLRSCSRSLAQAVFLALFSFPLILLLIPAGRWILALGGHPPEVLAAEKTYFTVLMSGGLFLPLSAAAASFFSGRGLTRTVMLCALAGTVMNLVLNGLLIFGVGPFPEMGIAGAAFASVISGFLSPVMMLWICFSEKSNRLYDTRNLFYFDPDLFRRLLRFGIPSGLHLAFNTASFTLFVLLIGRLGETAFMAANIALSVNMIAFMPAIGIGQAAGILAGQHIGRRDLDGASAVGWRAVHLGWVYTLCAAMTFVLMPEFYIRLFANGDVPFGEVVSLARTLLIFAACWGLMDATNLILSGALRGAGDTHFVMWYETAMAWFFFAAGELLIVLVLKRGVLAAWAWALVYISLLALGMIARFRSNRWQRIELIERREPVPEPVSADGIPA